MNNEPLSGENRDTNERGVTRSKPDAVTPSATSRNTAARQRVSPAHAGKHTRKENKMESVNTMSENKLLGSKHCPDTENELGDCSVVSKARSIEWLKSPDYFDLNKHRGRNDRLLHALFCAYVKHHFYEDTDNFGWNELDKILFDALTNEIGDDAFCKWIEEVK